ncbi:MAG TPA: MMPL family transporter, partial [Polyangiaceae bacterium]|nr:MMPL family transporter [Polyangiaceae bacterium]
MVKSWFSRLARCQVERPLPFVVAGLILAALSALLATRLELRTRFEELLPRARASVIELKRLQASVPSASHVFVVVERGSIAEQRAYGDALVQRLRQSAPPWLAAVDDGVHEARAFLAPRAGMFAELSELERLQSDVEARWSWEVGKQTGANLDDDEPPPALSVDELKKRLGSGASEPFFDGYFQARDGRALLVSVETSLATGDMAGSRAALEQIQTAAEALRREPLHARISLSYAGDLVTGLAEYGAALNDLLDVGALGLGLVTLVMFLFFLRVRALLALAASLAVGLSWTFGITYLTIGHLNVATGFLVSIVAGNGINFGIIYVARVYEERLKGRELKDAVESASLLTRNATLSAAAAASAAYGSLAISDFHAFRHFAVIGGVGMLVCWLAAFLFLPSALLVAERALPSWRSFRPSRPERLVYGQHYGAPLAAAVARAPRLLVVSGVGLAVLGLLTLFYYVRADPLEYDMRKLQNDLGSSSQMYRAS